MSNEVLSDGISAIVEDLEAQRICWWRTVTPLSMKATAKLPWASRINLGHELLAFQNGVSGDVPGCRLAVLLENPQADIVILRRKGTPGNDEPAVAQCRDNRRTHRRAVSVADRDARSDGDPSWLSSFSPRMESGALRSTPTFPYDNRNVHADDAVKED